MVDDPWRQRDPLNACVSRSSVSTGYDLNGLAASGVIVLYITAHALRVPHQNIRILRGPAESMYGIINN